MGRPEASAHRVVKAPPGALVLRRGPGAGDEVPALARRALRRAQALAYPRYPGHARQVKTCARPGFDMCRHKQIQNHLTHGLCGWMGCAQYLYAKKGLLLHYVQKLSIFQLPPEYVKIE